MFSGSPKTRLYTPVVDTMTHRTIPVATALTTSRTRSQGFQAIFAKTRKNVRKVKNATFLKNSPFFKKADSVRRITMFAVFKVQALFKREAKTWAATVRVFGFFSGKKKRTSKMRKH